MSEIAAFAFYKTKRWQKLRKYILGRDCICQICHCAKPTIAHHKTWITAENVNIPELVWGEDNLIAVCQYCHNRIHHADPNNSATWPELSFDENGNLVKID
jgi:hypothetical protein